MRFINIRVYGRTAIVLMTCTTQAFIWAQEQAPLSQRILDWSEQDQIAWIHSYLSDGMPPSEVIATLAVAKSFITLPLLESKVEEVIKSKSPKQVFNNRSIEPDKVVSLATSFIAYAANEQALIEASKLIRIDEVRFGSLVSQIFDRSLIRGNPYKLAYLGLAIGDPVVNQKIITWAQAQFGYKEEYMRALSYKSWAEAIVERYDGAPNFAQFANDPIAIRI